MKCSFRIPGSGFRIPGSGFRIPSRFRVSQVLNDLVGCQLVTSDWSDCTVQTVYTELVRALSRVHVYTQRGTIFGMSVDNAVVNTAKKVIKNKVIE